MTTTLTTRMNLEDKKDFEAFCASAGITPSSAVNMFVKCTLREGKIPFEIKADPFLSKANMERLENNAKLMDAGKAQAHEVDLGD